MKRLALAVSSEISLGVTQVSGNPFGPPGSQFENKNSFDIS